MKLKILVFFHPQVLITFLEKRMPCALIILPRKKKWINPKQVELEVVVSYKGRWQLFVLLLFLADFVTPRNTQSNLERYQLSNPERKTEIKAVSNRGKPSKSGRTNQNCETTNRIGCGDFECIKA